MAIHTIEATMPGIFYKKASPSDPPYKQLGDAVAIGDAVGLIEIMKTFMPVEATTAGRFVRFLVESGDEVDAGQALCEVEA
jgi:biotin carboxyl carrier protein